MKAAFCEHEETVHRAVGHRTAGRGLDADLEAHVRDCAVCGETVRVAAFLQRAAEADHPRLPTPSQLWWRARVVRRLTGQDPAADRATRPVMWGLGLGALVAVMALTLLVVGLGRVFAAQVSPDLGDVWAFLFLASVGFPVVAVAVLGLVLRESQG